MKNPVFKTPVHPVVVIWLTVYDSNKRPVSFTSKDGQTVISCGYDYMGRRYMKKVTVNGSVTLHQHYLYQGYLQIAALDLTRSNLPALWFVHWDPTEPVATRPLSVRKNATWYTYGHDLTKNVTELYKAEGSIASTYDYTPYGTVTATGIEQPLQWSSEVYDSELGMVYYNYCHYNPTDGRWIGRDPLGENGLIDDYENIDFTQIANLYAFGPNDPINGYDVIAESWGAILRFGLNLLRGTGRKTPKPTPPALKLPTPKPRPKQEPKPQPKKNFGDCTAAEHAVLNAAVGAACKGSQFSCNKKKNPNLRCDEIKLRIVRAIACVTAR